MIEINIDAELLKYIGLLVFTLGGTFPGIIILWTISDWIEKGHIANIIRAWKGLPKDKDQPK